MPKARRTCFVYVLKLQRGKYYVGSSTNPKARLQQHRTGGRLGAAWTSKYKPTKRTKSIKSTKSTKSTQRNTKHSPILQVTKLRTTSKQACRKAEDRKTRRLMCKHGIGNVRGGVYSQVKLDKQVRQDLRRYLVTKRLSSRCKRLEQWHQADRCVRCGSAKHWAGRCKASRGM